MSGQASYPESRKHVMDSFEFESGRVLENVTVEYVTRGIPKYDDDGNIINAIIYFPTLVGGHSILPKYHNIIKKFDFDVDEYFFIRIFSLGTPGSCSPSSTGLKHDFPSYTINDRVNFKRQFLAEKFNINKILGIVGEGIGGFEVFSWACDFPDEMEFIILLNSAYKIYGYAYATMKSLESMLDSSEDFYSEDYSSSLSLLSVTILRVLFMAYFPRNIIENLNNDELDVLMDDYVDEGLFVDIHDFKSRNDCILGFDVEDKLQNIKAKSLLLGTTGYLFYYPEKDLLPLGNLIKDSMIRLFETSKENYYDDPDNSQIIKEIISFLYQFK
ncbi:hypothetical protein [Methanobrevibacter sp.]|uniref:hypothetical protein n=1 Tax=Methanobrevibacter sp. TaxID=66852 RepID=UPI00388EEE21